MDHPATVNDFRSRLQAALARTHPRARLDDLARLARSDLNFVETIQLGSELARIATEAIEGYGQLRLAILSTSTVDHLLPAIRIAGLRRNLQIQAYPGAFGQYRQEVLDPASPLRDFRPGVILFSLTARQAISGVPLAAPAEVVDRALSRAVDEIRELWRGASRIFGSMVVQQTFLDVFQPLFGSYDRLVPAAPSRMVARLNDLIAQAAAEERILLLDVAQASAREGLNAWFDVARWLQGKMEISPQAAPRYGELLARLLDAQRGRSRKCLVLDLDNTLWGGVVGDVGTEGIALGEGSAHGEAYSALQHYTKQLKERGIILAVCSKNEPATAEAPFRDHPEMLLRRSDFAAFVANWNDKAENLRLIADQLNIGLDSLVFLDDNPAERARVRESLPMVAVPELPADPSSYVHCLANAGYFEAVSFTDDDAQRGAQYATNAKREALRGASQSMGDFLQGLNMSVTYGPILAIDLTRATQLLNKTNQFNTTTRRYTADEVSHFAAAPECLTLQFRLADRFGDNGLVSVMILRPAVGDPAAIEIDNWVMSCRVFGRQLEYEAMNIAVEAARNRGIESIVAEFIPTERNGVIANLYESLGFNRSPDQVSSGAATRWFLKTADYTPLSTFITRKAATA